MDLLALERDLKSWKDYSMIQSKSLQDFVASKEPKKYIRKFLIYIKKQWANKTLSNWQSDSVSLSKEKTMATTFS